MANKDKNKLPIEAEPIFCVIIEFADESNPVVYYNLSLAKTMDQIKEWAENWILVPDKTCKLSDPIWKWRAYPRDYKNIDPEYLEGDDESDEDEEVDKIIEDPLNKED